MRWEGYSGGQYWQTGTSLHSIGRPATGMLVTPQTCVPATPYQ
jgi:hypothetical protein